MYKIDCFYCTYSNDNSIYSVFENAHAYEIKVTGLINRLVELARSEKDIATENFLMWYVAEQVEEEASAYEIVQKLKLLKDSPNGLFILDKELGQRES